METMKFLMTDLGEATAACVSALESRGLEVTVCPRDGAQVLEKLLEQMKEEEGQGAAAFLAALDQSLPPTGREQEAVSQR